MTAALVLIDCQQSFIDGSWAKSFDCPDETSSIKATFEQIASVLSSLPDHIEILSSRFPFRVEHDFKHYSPINDALLLRGSRVQPVIKHGNDILHATGTFHWLEKMINKNVQTLVIGGCTLTSCVRVSASEIQKLCGLTSPGMHSDPTKRLTVIVDLSISAARDSNYVKRCRHCLDCYMNGLKCPPCTECFTDNEAQSPVDKTVDDLRSVGIEVVDNFQWKAL